MELTGLALKGCNLNKELEMQGMYLYYEDNGSWFRGNDARYVEGNKRQDAQKEGFHC